MKSGKGRNTEGKRNKAPQHNWQTGAFARHADFHFVLPVPFLMFCKLMNVTPDEILTDFIDNLSCSNWKREGRDHVKTLLTAYVIAHGYGQPRYSEDEISTIFREMDALGMVWPVHGNMALLELSAAWRDAYQEYWFVKWTRSQ